MAHQQTTQFRGQQYNFYQHTVTKAGAKGVVERLRKNSYKTHTIDCGEGGYDIYIVKK